MIEDWADESLYFYEITMRMAWEHNAKVVVEEFVKTLPGMTAEQALPAVMANAQELTSKQGLGRKPQDQILGDVDRHFAALEGFLSAGDFLAGDGITLADIAVISQMNALVWAQEAKERFEASAAIKAWHARVDAIAPA